MTDDDVTRCAHGCGAWIVRGTDCRTCRIIEADRTEEAWRAARLRIPKHTIQARLDEWWAA
jgi:hypothetical protein